MNRKVVMLVSIMMSTIGVTMTEGCKPSGFDGKIAPSNTVKYTEIRIEQLGSDVPMAETIKRHNDMVAAIKNSSNADTDGTHSRGLEKLRGGWGYTKETAVIIEPAEDSSDGINYAVGLHTEYVFAKRRVYEELRLYGDVDGLRPDVQCIRHELDGQRLVHSDGHYYDVLTFTVTGYPAKALSSLRQDFNDHNGYKDDSDGLIRHQALADKYRVGYKATYWFDITKIYGRR